jgi:hypothetical protein
MGRSPLHGALMTPTEYQRRYRAKLKKQKAEATAGRAARALMSEFFRILKAGKLPDDPATEVERLSVLRETYERMRKSTPRFREFKYALEHARMIEHLQTLIAIAKEHPSWAPVLAEAAMQQSERHRAKHEENSS